MITWAVLPDGINIWCDGRFIGVIPLSQFPQLIERCARELQAR